MPTSIYCRAPTTGSEGIPHVIPEALATNSLTLSKGDECDRCNDECDRCNNAMGKLDEMLILYPHIAFALQFFGGAGAKG